MADTYCGRCCDTCTYKEELNCPGCKDGPGRKLYGDCQISKCCFRKSQADCSNCTENHYCGLLRRKDEIPQKRLTRWEYERSQFEERKRLSKPLAKWLWILFWLVIPRELAGLMTNATVVQVLPQLYIPGLILQIVCGLTYGAILLYLTFASDHYKIAGWCCIAAMVISFASLLTESSAWMSTLSLINLVLMVVGTYQIFHAHAEALDYADPDLAEKWCKLFRWYVGMIVAINVSVILALSPLLTLLVFVVLACVVGAVVIDVLQLVYLYRTAKVFRDFPEEYPGLYPGQEK